MTTARLVPLDEYNYEKSGPHWELNSNQPRLNGLACPQCGSELLDTNPMQICTSMPPQEWVHCSNSECDYIGLRIA